MAAGCGRHREPIRRFQARRRSIVAEQNLGIASRRFPAPIIGQGRMKVANLVVAFKLCVLGANPDCLDAAPRRQLHRPIQHQMALLRVVGSAHGAAATLDHRKIHALDGGRNSGFLVEDQSDRLHMNLARCGCLGC